MNPFSLKLKGDFEALGFSFFLFSFLELQNLSSRQQFYVLFGITLARTTAVKTAAREKLAYILISAFECSTLPSSILDLNANGDILHAAIMLVPVSSRRNSSTTKALVICVLLERVSP